MEHTACSTALLVRTQKAEELRKTLASSASWTPGRTARFARRLDPGSNVVTTRDNHGQPETSTAAFDPIAPWLYRSKDLLARCPGAASLRDGIVRAGWPIGLGDQRGRPAHMVEVATRSFASSVTRQGVAGTCDILFVDTRREGTAVRAKDLDAPSLADAKLVDLSR
jgi:hypothetical protein